MDIIDIIEKKRDGDELNREEIRYFVKGFTNGSIPDYQASALLMAMYLNELTDEETFELTDAMKDSGDTIDLSSVRGHTVDKHSTGGVGDKTTLIVLPMVSACLVPVAKMSGRGLGFTGGTIDKLESIPGFRTSLTEEEFLDQVQQIGIALTGQTGNITPADKKIYALRDVTGTVENMSLIASSIMSKKLAAGNESIVLDVKTGKGAFMKRQKDARELAELMCRIGENAGRRTCCLITNMDQPLGYAVGNALEVKEAIDTLKGNGPDDLVELCEQLAGIMIYLGGRVRSLEEGPMMAHGALASGAALDKFRALVTAQGGDPSVIDDPDHQFPQAKFHQSVTAKTSGYVQDLDAHLVGQASRSTGAGRESLDQEIDPSAGILLRKKVGDKVSVKDELAVVYAGSKRKLIEGVEKLEAAYTIGNKAPEKEPLILDRVMGERL
ncbi:MAG: thymidine phosphorylase [Eubacterium sp.]|jgi:pyrimidine-nucleoside phosphorylase|nr:thymidine phosphorylase [Eubacterium sp.]